MTEYLLLLSYPGVPKIAPPNQVVNSCKDDSSQTCLKYCIRIMWVMDRYYNTYTYIYKDKTIYLRNKRHSSGEGCDHYDDNGHTDDF